jgi:hypothetical protein
MRAIFSGHIGRSTELRGDTRNSREQHSPLAHAAVRATARQKPRGGEAADVEATVVGEPSDTGFDARAADEATFPVVFPATLAPVHGPFSPGERLRILRGWRAEDGDGLELKQWSEVFHRAPAEQSC